MSAEVIDIDSARKGLRFEVSDQGVDGPWWFWELHGKEGPVCKSVKGFHNETEARADIARNKGRMKAAGYARVITVED